MDDINKFAIWEVLSMSVDLTLASPYRVNWFICLDLFFSSPSVFLVITSPVSGTTVVSSVYLCLCPSVLVITHPLCYFRYLFLIPKFSVLKIFLCIYWYVLRDFIEIFSILFILFRCHNVLWYQVFCSMRTYD